ncbi:MAG: heavy metal-responsive transcriptional regulator, partial [Armatimonadota bacterium]
MFIGELARATGVSVPTIRYYETLGLLKPVKRTRGGFRVYDEHALLILRFIRHAQRLGFSLKDVRRVLRDWRRTGNPCPTVRTLVAQRLAQLDEWLQSLLALRERLQWLTQMLEARQGNDPSTICPCITATEPLDISL